MIITLVDNASYAGFHCVVIDDYNGRWKYGFKEKRKQIEPVIFESDEPELRGDYIDFSFLKFWKWI